MKVTAILFIKKTISYFYIFKISIFFLGPQSLGLLPPQQGGYQPYNPPPITNPQFINSNNNPQNGNYNPQNGNYNPTGNYDPTGNFNPQYSNNNPQYSNNNPQYSNSNSETYATGLLEPLPGTAVDPASEAYFASVLAGKKWSDLF